MSSPDTLLSQWSELWRFPGLTRLLRSEPPPEGWSAWDLCRAMLEAEEDETAAGALRLYNNALDDGRFDDARNFRKSSRFCELIGRSTEEVDAEIDLRHAKTRRVMEDSLKRLRQVARNLTISLRDFNWHAAAVERAVSAGRFQAARDALEQTEIALADCLKREEAILIPDAAQVSDDTLRQVRLALADSRPGLARLIAEHRQSAPVQSEVQRPPVRDLQRDETWLQVTKGLLGIERMSPYMARRWGREVSDETARALLTLLHRVHEYGVARMDNEFVSRFIGAIGACFGRNSVDDNTAPVRLEAVDCGFLCTTTAPDWLRLAPFLASDQGDLTILLPLRNVAPNDLAPASICLDVFGMNLPRGTQGVVFLGIGDLLAYLGSEDRACRLARTLALQLAPQEILAEDAPTRRGARGRATRLLTFAAELDDIDPWGMLSEEEMRGAARRFLARLGIDVLGYDFELMMYLTSQRPIIFYRLLHCAIRRSFFRASRQVSGHSVFRHILAEESILADGVAIALEDAGIDLDTAKAIIDLLDEHAFGGINLVSKWFAADKFKSMLSEYGFNPLETISLLVRARLIDEGDIGYRTTENGVVERIRSQ